MAGSVSRCCLRTALCRLIKGSSKFSPVVIQVAGLKDVRPPEEIDITIPEKPKLKPMQKVPDPPHRKEFRNLIEIRGPELHNNTLKHGQFGIQALAGGYMKHGHFEMIRFGINRYIGSKKNVFAEWRVDAPYKSVTKRPPGTRMGGGKASINHWVTPVRSGRIIVELCGKLEWKEVEKILNQTAEKLPFAAKAVSQQIMDKDLEKDWEEMVNNQNPWTFERIVRGNYMGIQKYTGPYDFKWFDKHK
ncbi:large ribosomal subunit protein uL16m-like [Amphiura filiformis]|uniref:large ribosomal subunit protein uL16m-like n=1 Tax=Amphiura filiformis TaxID=82378 RepID=UPI003B20BF32